MFGAIYYRFIENGEQVRMSWRWGQRRPAEEIKHKIILLPSLSRSILCWYIRIPETGEFIMKRNLLSDSSEDWGVSNIQKLALVKIFFDIASYGGRQEEKGEPKKWTKCTR